MKNYQYYKNSLKRNPLYMKRNTIETIDISNYSRMPLRNLLFRYNTINEYKQR